MNILQILPKLDVGGVETGTIDLAKELINRGHKVIVVSGGGKLVKNLIDISVKHIELPVHKKSPFTVIKCIKNLEEIIRIERIDVVHSRSRVPNIIAFFAARRAGAKFITTAHGYYSNHFISLIVTGYPSMTSRVPFTSLFICSKSSAKAALLSSSVFETIIFLNLKSGISEPLP